MMFDCIRFSQSKHLHERNNKCNNVFFVNEDSLQEEKYLVCKTSTDKAPVEGKKFRLH